MVRAAPPEIGATAQGYLAVAQGLVMAGAMGLAGLLYARDGNLAYAAMALMAAAGAASALAALRFVRQTASRNELISTATKFPIVIEILDRHARACRGHPRLSDDERNQDVDARPAPGMTKRSILHLV